MAEESVDWPAFLACLKAGAYVRNLLSRPPARSRRGMPTRADIRRKKRNRAFAAAYAAACDEGNRVRVAAGIVPQQQQMGGQIDWENFLLEVAAGGYVGELRARRPNPNKWELAERRASDELFAARFKIARKQGHAARATRGLVRESNAIEVDWARFEERVAAGEPVLAVVGGYEMPSRTQVYRRRQSDPLFGQRLAEYVEKRRSLSDGRPRRMRITAEILAAIDSAMPRKLGPQEREEVRQEVVLDIMQQGLSDASVKDHIAAAVSRVMESLYGDALSLDDLADKGFDPTGGTLPWARSKKREKHTV